MAGNETPIFNKLHAEKEVGTPRMGGVVIWASVLISLFLIRIFAQFLPVEIFNKLEFLSRNQTWIPVAVLLIGAIFGMVDDLMEIRGSKDQKSGGLSFRKRLSIVGSVGLAVSLWFLTKLGVDSIGIPFMTEPLYVGWLIVPIFTLAMLVIYTGGVIDGLDGLSGGVFAIIFSAYGFIAFSLGQVDLAALCGAISGGILAFLWFNIPPARFYMSETGTMALTMTLTVIAFMTDSIVGGVGLFVLPIIGLLLIASGVTSVLQTASKKFLNKKILLAAPLHHHFEAIGWPAYKITMRYWIIGIIFAFIGIILSLIG